MKLNFTNTKVTNFFNKITVCRYIKKIRYLSKNYITKSNKKVMESSHALMTTYEIEGGMRNNAQVLPRFSFDFH